MKPCVAQRTTLTEKQVSILHWIADGLPTASWTVTHTESQRPH